MQIINKKIVYVLCLFTLFFSSCRIYHSPNGAYKGKNTAQKELPGIYRCLIINPDRTFSYSYKFDLEEENSSGIWEYTDEKNVILMTSDIKNLQQIPVSIDTISSYITVDSVSILLKGFDIRYCWYISNGNDSIRITDSCLCIGYDFIKEGDCYLVGLYKNQRWINMIKNKYVKTNPFFLSKMYIGCTISMKRHDLPNYVPMEEKAYINCAGVQLHTLNVFLKKCPVDGVGIYQEEKSQVR